jgi:hypothetical protein
MKLKVPTPQFFDIWWPQKLLIAVTCKILKGQHFKVSMSATGTSSLASVSRLAQY